MAKQKTTYTVQILGGSDTDTRTAIVYTGESLQFASHDANVARTTAVLSRGTAVIVTRKDGVELSRLNIHAGMVVETKGAAAA